MEKYCIFTEEKKFTIASVEVKEGRFSAIHKEKELSEEEAFSCPEDFLLPGLIDIHFHGCLGEDFCDGTREAMQTLAKYEAEHGITVICPATLTLAVEDLEKMLSLAKEYHEEGLKIGEARLLGINMEGPFISPVKKGAQNPNYILKWDEKACGAILALLRRTGKVYGLGTGGESGFPAFYSENAGEGEDFPCPYQCGFPHGFEGLSGRGQPCGTPFQRHDRSGSQKSGSCGSNH